MSEMSELIACVVAFFSSSKASNAGDLIAGVVNSSNIFVWSSMVLVWSS